MQNAHRLFRRSLGLRATTPLRGPDSMREVVFSACLPSEVAYETAGNGDYTHRAVPFLQGAATLTNDQFLASVTQAFGVPARQHPNIDCPPGWGSQPLFGAPGAAAAAGRGITPSSTEIVQCLRTLAGLLRS
jgi:hypothetical protein